jgi:hypothetical protein
MRLAYQRYASMRVSEPIRVPYGRVNAPRT